MRHKHFAYSAVNVDVIELEPFEVARFEQQANDNSYGIYVYYGNAEREGPKLTRLAEPSQYRWHPNVGHMGWSNETIGGTELLVKCDEAGMSWMCLSRNGSGEREIRQVTIDGSWTLPAGWGFVVARGDVLADGKHAKAGSYFRPRETEIQTAGFADLLLVK